MEGRIRDWILLRFLGSEILRGTPLISGRVIVLLIGSPSASDADGSELGFGMMGVSIGSAPCCRYLGRDQTNSEILLVVVEDDWPPDGDDDGEFPAAVFGEEDEENDDDDDAADEDGADEGDRFRETCSPRWTGSSRVEEERWVR